MTGRCDRSASCRLKYMSPDPTSAYCVDGGRVRTSDSTDAARASSHGWRFGFARSTSTRSISSPHSKSDFSALLLTRRCLADQQGVLEQRLTESSVHPPNVADV